jgi:hypothetical protein
MQNSSVKSLQIQQQIKKITRNVEGGFIPGM